MNDLLASFFPLIILLTVLFALLIGYAIGRLTKRPPAPKLPPPAYLRLFSGEDEQPQLEMDGQLLTPPLNAEQRRRLITLLNLIRPWLEGTAAAAPVASSPPPSRQPASASPAATQHPTAAPQPVETPASPAAPQPPSPPSLSIIAQIDEILQRKLQHSSQTTQKIRLFEGEDGSVHILVGLTRYTSIDAIPDEGIRQLIRAAVAEWEKKQG